MKSVNSGAAAHTDDAVGASAEGKETSLPSASKKVKIFGGFSSARDFMNSGNACASASVASDGQKITAAVPFKTKISAKSNDNEFSIDLLVRGLNYHKENLTSMESITLHREPKNMFDPNAIAAHNDKGGVVGHVAREQAAQLAPFLDECSIIFQDIIIKEQRHDNFTLMVSATVAILKLDNKDKIRSVIETMNTDQTGIISTFDTVNTQVAEHLSMGISAQDIKTATECSVDFSKVKTLPWKKDADGKALAWPPPNEVMAQFGFGSIDDKQWWNKNGLNPPSQWNVSGALDILPSVSISSHQKEMARDALDDAVHGVTNIWSDETMNKIGALMHSSNFWSHRGADAFIKAYGGPYVLGQQEGKLKLIKGNPHVDLTEKLCRGHNIVYTLIHSEPPAGSGFNTLIFGLNLRRSGFHYHQDAIGSLKAKNAPLLPRQPVVTTVYYQKPQLDDGKEMVLWKPLMNFKPKDDSLYMAARGIVTSHGMVHVQKAGLQSKVEHGIFRTPCNSSDEAMDIDPRMGYRVAVTARITYDDSENRLEPFLKGDHYNVIIGPEGNKTLSL